MNPLEIPRLEKYVNDFSGVLDDEHSSLLNELFAEHDRITGEQIVVVLFPHRRGNELSDIGLKLFNENQIGKKDFNNGLLLIIATEEQKIRIVTGKGMELQYTEMVCRDIVENQLRQFVNQGKYRELIMLFSYIVQHSQNTPRGSDRDPGLRKKRRENIGMVLYVLTLLSVMIFFIHTVIMGLLMMGFGIGVAIYIWNKRKTSDNKWYYIALVFPIVFFLVGILAILRPGLCTLVTEKSFGVLQTYSCDRDIYGYTLHFDYSVGGTGSSLYPRSGYSSRNIDNSSSSSREFSHSSYSSSDSSSSFGGGGGSSNGGGYGD